MTLKLEDCINTLCPWSGDPVSADSLTLYKGQVVGFCNPGCRDKFEKATSLFEDSLNVDTKEQAHG
ncbi:MAG: glutathione S-transferase [Pseudomonadota bacterium]